MANEKNDDFDDFDDLDGALGSIIDPDAGVSEFEVTESTEEDSCPGGACRL